LQARSDAELVDKLETVEPVYRGFAYEGTAMALALLDGITLRGRRLQQFLGGAGRHHVYMLHVGAGWAGARLPWLRLRMDTAISQYDRVLRWLAVDGYGFHEGYFHHDQVINAGKLPSRLSETARHVFLQGLGRSLWFVHGADILEISQTIAGFHPDFRGDAWSGAGLACAYAGGSSRNEIEELRWIAGSHASSAAQGAAFAAKARQLAGNPARHTEIACEILCGMNSERAAALCDETLAQVSDADPSPYQRWRELLRNSFAPSFTLRGKPHELTPQPAAPKHS
ncbi:MAG TPA: DUF1702 family protein, partial [Candidatus Angelobacter sp.]|nr:DUF1702 family protein [Candidatus Angelobacter sp.]